ncbi:MAG: S-layer homology domain-containing protein [Peptoniphilus sp. oral taxon 375]|nr:S-layer homology domain-containing protein [Peptoniphilus sp. oral taxon 375]
MKKLNRILILFLCIITCIPMTTYAKGAYEKPTHLNISIQKNEMEEYSHFTLSWSNPKSIQDKINKGIPIMAEIDLKNNGDPWHSEAKKPLVQIPLEKGAKSQVILDENSFATVKEFNVFLSNYSFRVRYRLGNTQSDFSSYVSVGLRPNLKNVSSWAVENLNQANKLGLVPNSVKSDLKSPISREEFAHALVLAYEKKAGKVASLSSSGFSDAKQSYILKAKELGFIQGVGGNRFNPKGKITREEMATMVAKLCQTLGKEGHESQGKFKDDESISFWAKGSVYKMESLGLIKGYNGKFSPKKTSSREEALIVAYGIVNLK